MVSWGASVRYRLRTGLQEIDLIADEVLIGRGSRCGLTIDDPMISREHLRLDLSGDQPRVQDLGSRNGTLLNGRALQSSAVLSDGDRIRLGSQELVFLIARPRKSARRTTGPLSFCNECGIPYPSDSYQCPHCGWLPTEPGITRDKRDVLASSWTFHLLSDVVERAMNQGRLADAERMMTRGMAELERQLDRGADVAVERVYRIAECAARLGCALRSSHWVRAAAALYARIDAMPSRDVLVLMDSLSLEAGLASALGSVRRSSIPPMGAAS